MALGTVGAPRFFGSPVFIDYNEHKPARRLALSREIYSASRAEEYGPIAGEYWHSVMFGPRGNPLGPTDIAASPDLVSRFGFGSLVDAVDAQGNVVNSGLRIADLSYRAPGVPNINTFEMRNMHDRGWLRLVPHGSGGGGTQQGGDININQTVHIHGSSDEQGVHRAMTRSRKELENMLEDLRKNERRRLLSITG